MKPRTTILAALLACSSLFAAETAPYAYHLRVVRVSPSTAIPGAALGWAPNGGAPVLLPDDEAWGTPEQLEALADALDGDRAEAVTGFYVLAGSDGILEFVRTVYVGESILKLTLRSVPPAARRGAHDVELILEGEKAAGPPLAEARVRIATDRTVAIAAPGEGDGDWIVLALTPLEPGHAAERARESMEAATLDGSDVTMPRLITPVEPKYPRGARTERLTGRIVIAAIIDEDGVPRAPTILKMPPGTEELAGAAVEAVKQWRYEPATRGGKPIAVEYHVVMQFRLE